jgi:hypothetical protein
MIHRSGALIFCMLLLAACTSGGVVPGAGSPTPKALRSAVSPSRTKLDVPPRLQWMANYGYCGETSMISAGLYYGQYVSQYKARNAASDGVPQSRRGSQLLLGVNDTHAAAALHLNALEWNTAAEKNTNAFLAWVRDNVELGYPVTIGVYTNEYRFYGKTAPRAGDPSYDHIVPVTAVAADSLTFSDNGLWDPSGPPRYLFSYGFAAFQKSRTEANAHRGPIYSLSNNGSNYGIAITGVMDPEHETVPVRLTTSVNDELPAMRNGSNVRPKPRNLVLTITVSGLKPGVGYRLYRYDRLVDVPDAGFNAFGAKAARHWDVQISSGTTYTLSERMASNAVAVYRAVPASGP